MKVTWTAPSNIALVKYWGKYGVQLPKNPSISFTLKHSVTELSIEANKLEALNEQPSINFFFEGLENLKFKTKIVDILLTLTNKFPWLLNYHLDIRSTNTFPHSSGIASSASSMSALCLSLLSLDELITGKKLGREEFLILASELSRLASGSASRSLYGGLVSWGESKSIANSSNLFGTPFVAAADVFSDYCDSILIVDVDEKSVSSRAGHKLMESHPYREQRFKQAYDNHDRLISALVSGDLPTFIEIVE